MKEIPLTQGKVALVDDEDYDYLMQWKWCVAKQKGIAYAIRSRKIKGRRTTIYMHRLIVNKLVGMEVDHVDHDGLNNQKQNLRVCTKKQNLQNRTPHGVSKYLGVSHSGKRYRSKYRAVIYSNGKRIHLGYFHSEIEAAKAFDIAAQKHHGEFSNLNFK